MAMSRSAVTTGRLQSRTQVPFQTENFGYENDVATIPCLALEDIWSQSPFNLRMVTIPAHAERVTTTASISDAPELSAPDIGAS
jgi:hypothetical protein